MNKLDCVFPWIYQFDNSTKKCPVRMENVSRIGFESLFNIFKEYTNNKYVNLI